MTDDTHGSPTGAGFKIPASVLAALEATLNRYIALDPEGAQGFAPLYGRIIAIAIEGIGARLTLIPGPDRIQVFGAYDATPDCLIRGTPLALLRLVTAQRKESQLSSGAVQIEGDTTLAHGLSNAMAGLDVDWEEQLARVLGDPIANQMGRGWRAAGDWSNQTAERLRANLKEYLEEESRLLPTRYQVDSFVGEVDRVRDDVERLAARIEQLMALAPATGAEPGGRR
ncbi:SCP2 sterol-binding domain-containing protein [uncultured Thiodictyon sp.]|uniref:ubiquinone biosynthesis accessory factor UbiJ n=1 Tax=uncultured Thiodictyon sp. TaxID=1846217 RepID=UPI0025D62249|nr:SCP2 sterol-binding domain-containing protein [uncultured Thiodictyon sp.]